MLAQVRWSSAGSCARYFQKLLTSSTCRVRLMSSNTARTSALALRYSIGVRGIGVLLRPLDADCRKRGERAQSAQPSESGNEWERDMPRTPDYFAGKTILITGAASGIGRATALIFA